MKALATQFSLLFAVLAAGCYDDPGYVPPQAPTPAATVVVRVAPAHESMAVAMSPTLSANVDRVRVYTTKDIGGENEVVGVLDFHTDADSQDKGFALLKARAAALGADAVIGAEFEHGEGGGVSHLSGIAVKLHPAPE